MDFSNIQLSPHFTLYEMCQSTTADKKGINNIPTCEQIVNLFRLSKELETIRRKFGKPIRVNSGFRCPVLNSAVGGSPNSDHLSGSAVDITSEDNHTLWQIIVNLAHNKDIYCCVFESLPNFVSTIFFASNFMSSVIDIYTFESAVKITNASSVSPTSGKKSAIISNGKIK